MASRENPGAALNGQGEMTSASGLPARVFPAERAAAIAATRQYITLAARLGAETILVVPGAVDVARDPSRPVVPYD